MNSETKNVRAQCSANIRARMAITASATPRASTCGRGSDGGASGCGSVERSGAAAARCCDARAKLSAG